MFNESKLHKVIVIFHRKHFTFLHHRWSDACTAGKAISYHHEQIAQQLCDVLSAKHRASSVSHLFCRPINQRLNKWKFSHFSSFSQALFCNNWHGAGRRWKNMHFNKNTSKAPSSNQNTAQRNEKNNPISNEFIDLRSDETEIVAILWCTLRNNGTKSRSIAIRKIFFYPASFAVESIH